MHRRLGIVFAIFAGFASAQAAVAPSANMLAECRLEYSVAQAELKKLKVIKRTNHSDKSSYDLLVEYDAAKIRPFGVQATRIELNDYEDPDGQYFELRTEIAQAFDKVKPKVLKAFGMTECGRDKAPDAKRCGLFLKGDGGKRHVEASLRTLKTGVSRFDCTYYD